MDPGEVRGRLWELLAGFIVTQAISSAVQLGVPDAIEDEPVGVAELAERTESDEESLYRLLRALAAEGVFREVEPRRFGHTPLSQGLRDDAPISMRPHAIMLGREHYAAWGDAVQTFRTGDPAFDRVHGSSFFDYLAKHPDVEANFARAMAWRSRARTGAVGVRLERCPHRRGRRRRERHRARRRPRREPTPARNAVRPADGGVVGA